MRRTVHGLLGLVLLLLLGPPVNGQVTPALRVNEARLGVSFEAGRSVLSVPVTNAGAPTSASIGFDVLDPDDRVVASHQERVRIASGSQVVRLPLPLTTPDPGAGAVGWLWYRLAYRVAASAAGPPIASGVVSLGAIAPDLFELRIVYRHDAVPGQSYLVRVHAVNPVTRRPVAGVVVRGTLTSEDEARGKPLVWAATTGPSGEAVLRYAIPRAGSATEARLSVDARKGPYLRRRDVPVSLGRFGELMVSVDKPIYQPGQALHARALALDETRHAVANRVLRFTLRSPNNEDVFREDVKTNEFGIASIDRTLPDGERAGDYWLQVEPPDPAARPSMRGGQQVRVRRYDLPTFSVSATADRTYYLPGQNAVVDVSATYLFGKPVASGSVRLVREESRHWNYEKQRWDSIEQDVQTSALDATGRARFRVDLAALFAGFEGSTRRFADHRYAAFVTDGSTGRTEQRRMALRLSQEPVHLYVSGSSFVGRSLSCYLTASYPDGSPAQVSIRVGVAKPAKVFGSTAHETVEFVRTISTNRYGVAKLVRLDLSVDEDDREHMLVLEARGRSGATARHEEYLWARERDIDVTTDKTLYRAGDPIKVSLRAPGAGSVVVDVERDSGAVWSARVHLHGDEAFLVIPYRESFKGRLRLTVYSLDALANNRERGPLVGAHSVLYPQDTELRVLVSPSRRSYSPADAVSAAVHVTSPSGLPQRSALGVVVFDQAVAERARTEDEFGRRSWSFWGGAWATDDFSVGGVSLRDLNRIDLGEEVPDGLDLAAEVLLNAWRYPNMPTLADDNYGVTALRRFRRTIVNRLVAVTAALESATPLPVNAKELDATLRAKGLDIESVRDPWDRPFVYTFGVLGPNRQVTVSSSGPDRVPGTDDDIDGTTVTWKYFTPEGRIVDLALNEATSSSGPCPLEYSALRTAALRHGLDLDSLRDPWGQRYLFQFDVHGSFCRVRVNSRGGLPATGGLEFAAWTSEVDYFAVTRKALVEAVSSGAFPRQDADLDRLVSEAHLPLRHLRDPWGRPYVATFERTTDYGDRLRFSTDSRPDVTPVTVEVEWVKIWSAGIDGAPGTDDDILLAAVSQLVTERTGASLASAPAPGATRLSAGMGGVRGVVTDTSGGVIPGADVLLRAEWDGTYHRVVTAADGSYFVGDVTPGLYRVQFSLVGFRTELVRDVPILTGGVTVVDAILKIGRLEETVQVTGATEIVQTQAASVMTTTGKAAGTLPGEREVIATPRLRDFFPETLYWAPSLVTDTAGRATLRFALADSITTWKMSVVASTTTGEIGTAQLDLLAFQPFFVDHDPPKVLTVGDEIDLPVVLRNYLPKRQDVTVAVKPEAWFALLGPSSRAVRVEPDAPARVVFPFRAAAAVTKGRQEIAATGTGAGDRVEKTVAVHPNGEPRSTTAGGLLREALRLALPLPGDVMAGSARTMVKLYPNVLAHVVESLEGGLQRPYGCAEQMISSTYPSVLLLRHYRETRVDGGPIARRAERYARDGVQRLLGYRAAAGGFGYWGGEPDEAVTAYAVRFLMDAAALVPVDEKVVHDAVGWLVSRQQTDGWWKPRYGREEVLTSYVTRVLARVAKTVLDVALRRKVEAAVTRALDALGEPREPYSMALVALAAWDVGRAPAAQAMVATLRGLAHQEAGDVYWALEGNTAFYGWGTSGRLEATAGVVTALATIDGSGAESASLVDSGVRFLLRNKDRYGVWYSGQATMSVLDALLSTIRGGAADEATRATIVVNGQPGPSLDIPPSPAATTSLTADISALVRPGENTIEVRRTGRAGEASVQVVSDYYVPWARGSEAREAVATGEARALRLGVTFDKTSVQVGDTVTCAVDVERIGHRGYGMLLAEVGLPPGAEVDRASLDKARDMSGWELSSYEVQPDRVVFYVWPRAGGTTFSFAFRPRFSMKALTGPSLLYDYYNPDAHVVVPPARMQVEPLGAGTTRRQR